MWRPKSVGRVTLKDAAGVTCGDTTFPHGDRRSSARTSGGQKVGTTEAALSLPQGRFLRGRLLLGREGSLGAVTAPLGTPEGPSGWSWAGQIPRGGPAAAYPQGTAWETSLALQKKKNKKKLERERAKRSVDSLSVSNRCWA